MRIGKSVWPRRAMHGAGAEVDRRTRSVRSTQDVPSLFSRLAKAARGLRNGSLWLTRPHRVS
jgi:hypothetical protein